MNSDKLLIMMKNLCQGYHEGVPRRIPANIVSGAKFLESRNIRISRYGSYIHGQPYSKVDAYTNVIAEVTIRDTGFSGDSWRTRASLIVQYASITRHLKDALTCKDRYEARMMCRGVHDLSRHKHRFRNSIRAVYVTRYDP